MPQLKPVSLELPDSTTVTLNPVSNRDNRFDFMDAAATSISMKQRMAIKVRAADVKNTGHVVNVTLIQPVAVDVPAGCCPTTGVPPQSSFEIRTLRANASSDTEATQLYEELKAYVASEDFKALMLGSSYF